MKIIDFHAHILPRLDHGSRSSQVSLAQLQLMSQAGVDTVCATSHFYPQEILVDDFLEARAASLARLLEISQNKPRPKIILGAEVLICEGLDRMEGLEKLCLEGTDILLLEMPFSAGAWSDRLYRTVAEISNRGIRPVFAHVDRYPYKLVEALFDMGFQAQLNAVCLSQLLKPKHLMRWIEEGKIIALGSDLHGDNAKAYEPFTKVCGSLGDQAQRIMENTDKLISSAVRH